jgi:hypothetical protein
MPLCCDFVERSQMPVCRQVDISQICPCAVNWHITGDTLLDNTPDISRMPSWPLCRNNTNACLLVTTVGRHECLIVMQTGPEREVNLYKTIGPHSGSEAGVRSAETEFTNDLQYQELTLINLPFCGISVTFYLNSYLPWINFRKFHLLRNELRTL